MNQYDIVWSERAEADLKEIYLWLAGVASDEVAIEYARALKQHMLRFQNFPNRGTLRDDIERGLRTTNYRGKTVIAYRADDKAVYVLRVIHAGRDWPQD